MTTGAPGDGADDGPVLEAVDMWKAFGRNAEAGIELARGGLAKDQVLAKSGAVLAVRDVSFSVRRGETFIVMGLSGSGKSTLLRCLARLIEPTEGDVLLDGQSILALDADELRELRRGRLAMVFQHFGLLPHRTVRGNVEYGLEVQGLKPADRRAAGDRALELVGLGDWADRYPDQLSGGMQQRVGLARALAVEPEIVFFDEPFSALDPLIRRDMQDELLELQATDRRTIVFITHDFDEALRLGDRIAIMKDGAVDQIGSAADLVTRPATAYVREFTRDISKARVTPVAALVSPGEVCSVDPVTESTPLEVVLPRLVASSDPVSVIDRAGGYLGDIDRSAAHALLDGATGA